jgi:CBS domain-containing protein
MLTDFRVLAPLDTLAHAINMILAGSQQDFPVVENGAVVGMLTRAAMLKAIAERGEQTLVGDVMQREFQQASVSEDADVALARLQACGCHSMPVLRDGHLLGVLTMDNVGEYVMVQSALRRARTVVQS